MTERVGDLVIGAGVIGVNCAEALRAAGRDVVLVDRGAVCSGCSWGNTGWISASHSLPLPGPGLVKQTLKWMLDGESPLYIQPSLRPSLWAWLWRFYRHCNEAAQLRGLAAMAELNRHTVAMTQELIERYRIDCQFQQRGVLYVFRTDAGLEKGAKECEFVRRHGVPGKLLDRDEVHKREPVLSGEVCGGVFYPGVADCIPDQFVQQLAAQLPSLGVRILTETEVEGFALSGSRIEQVGTSAGTFQPETVILASGACSGVLARRLGLRLSIEPGKGYSITLERQPGVPEAPLNLSEAKVAVTPWQDRVRFAGTMELAGFERAINQRRVEAIIRTAKCFFPEFQAEGEPVVWAGMRPVSSDGLPIIGRSSKLGNLILATGHGMLGLTQAVVTGRLVADLVTGRAPLIPIEPFSPDRQ